MPLYRDMAGWLYVPAVMSLAAILPLPYDYYLVLRLVVPIAAAVVAWNLYQLDRQVSGLVVAFVLIGIIFNPILPLHLSRLVWFPINLASGVLFALVAFTNPFPRR